MSDALAALVARLGLTDDEALEVFGLDPLSVIAGEHSHRPEIAILDVQTAEAALALGGDAAIARWLRVGVGGSTPLDLLRNGRFDAFEDALAARADEAQG